MAGFQLYRLLSFILYVYRFILIARAVVSWLPVDPRHPAVLFLHRVTEPLLAPIRRIIPPLGMIDISIIVLFILLHVAERVLFNILVTPVM